MTTSSPAPALHGTTPADVPGIASVVVNPGGDITVQVAGTAGAGRPVDEATTFHACSMAKLVTTIGVLRLVEEGALTLDDDVRDLLGTDAVAVPTDLRAPTLRELLAHQGGIEDPAGAFEPTAAGSPSAAEILTGATAAHDGRVSVVRAPGTGFSYSDAGYVLAERIVEVATGVPFAAALHRTVVAPLGLTSTAFWTGEAAGPHSPDAARRVAATAATGHDASGGPVAGNRVHYPGLAASGLWTTPGDLGLLLRDLGRSLAGDAGTVLLSPASALAMSEGVGTRGVGLGSFRLAAAHGLCLMSQGWGAGFQAQARVYVGDRSAVAVLVAADPGVPQESSVVGRTVTRLAQREGWED
ncbi:serine hydrolase domain-containing protein [Cellulomonas citrea]|uniref:serine hydrolase domain-containing protein n=1 Tax=Cellulomonas citrea TaxID=1909423 RepID=UPI001359678D|nr:serine hydrolase domain-containing protein [Cellulomonas citrea]